MELILWVTPIKLVPTILLDNIIAIESGIIILQVKLLEFNLRFIGCNNE